MYSRVEILTPPVPLVDTNFVMQHARLDSSAPDMAQLEMYINVAYNQAELFLNRAILTQTIRWTVCHSAPRNNAYQNTNFNAFFVPLNFAYFGACAQSLRLPRNPVQSITSVVRGYWDQDDVTLTEGTDYWADLTTDPARIRLQQSWYGCADHLAVTFTAGYGATAASIPPGILNPLQYAICVGATALYEDRQAGEMPPAFYRILGPIRAGWV